MKRTFKKSPVVASESLDAIQRFKAIDWDNVSYEEQFDLEMDYLSDIENDVLEGMGLWMEPSVQGTKGGIWIMTMEDDETVVDGYDYGDYVNAVIDIALDCDNVEQFKHRFEDFINDLMED